MVSPLFLPFYLFDYIKQATHWYPPTFNSPENCTGACLPDGSKKNKSSCETGNFCTACAKDGITLSLGCRNEALCKYALNDLHGLTQPFPHREMQYCSSPVGCFVPYAGNDTSNCEEYIDAHNSDPTPVYWTPNNGCIFAVRIFSCQWNPFDELFQGMSGADCALINGTYLDDLETKESCFNWTGICRIENHEAGYDVPGTTARLPEGYNLMDEAECNSCANHTWVPFFQWKNVRYIS